MDMTLGKKGGGREKKELICYVNIPIPYNYIIIVYCIHVTNKREKKICYTYVVNQSHTGIK